MLNLRSFLSDNFRTKDFKYDESDGMFNNWNFEVLHEILVILGLEHLSSLLVSPPPPSSSLLVTLGLEYLSSLLVSPFLFLWFPLLLLWTGSAPVLDSLSSHSRQLLPGVCRRAYCHGSRRHQEEPRSYLWEGEYVTFKISSSSLLPSLTHNIC